MATLPSSRPPWFSAALGLLLLLAFAVRGAVNARSFWYDELYTIQEFANRPWGEITGRAAAHPAPHDQAGAASREGDQGAGRGPRYSPNNHVLSTLLMKACDEAGVAAGAWRPMEDLGGVGILVFTDPTTLRFRLPSIVAGALLVLALAWPLRRDAGRWTAAAFVGGGAAAAFHPWLAAFSTEARGYALMLLLAGVATNLLDSLRGWRVAAYAACMAGAIYTVPVAAAALAGHAAVIALRRGAGWKGLALGAGAAALTAAALYGPFVPAMRHTAGQIGSPLSVGAFVSAALTAAATGWATPSTWGAVAGAALLAGGGYLAWRRDSRTRAAVVTHAVAAAVTLVIALALPGLRQARFLAWLAPLAVIAVYGLAIEAWRWRRAAGAGVAAAAAVAWGWADVTLARVPPQPILDAVEFAAGRAPAGAPIVGVYLGAAEMALYAPFFGDHPGRLVYSDKDWAAAKADAGGEMWAIVCYPAVLQAQWPEMDEDLRRRGEVVADLPGRVSPVRVIRLAPTVTQPTR